MCMPGGRKEISDNNRFELRCGNSRRSGIDLSAMKRYLGRLSDVTTAPMKA